MRPRSFVLAFSAAAFATAQVQPGNTPLTLAQARAIALRSHPQIAAAQNVAGAAGQGIVEARAAYFPTIKGEVTAGQAHDQSRIGAGTLSTSLLFDKFAQGLEVDQLITDLGRTKNLVANSQFNAKAEQENVATTRADIILGVTRSWFAALQAQAFVRVAQDTLKARQAVANQVGALAKAQLKSQIDVSFANVNVAQARLLLIRAQDSVEVALADLSRALGEDRPVNYQLQESPAPDTMPPDDQNLVNTAIQNRPELRELRYRLDAAKSFEAAERDLQRPNVTLVGVGGALPYLNQDPRITPHDYEGVAVNLEIPIFNGHLFSARREAAHFQSLASDQRLRDMRQQVEHDVRTAWLAASSASQRIPVADELVKQARQSSDLAQGRYNLGLASILEITQAQLAVTQADIEIVNARYEYENALAGLQYTIGLLQ